jgi:hypothetical protein
MIDRVLGWLERLPGTAIPWLAVLTIGLAVVANLPAWIAGARAVGTFELMFLAPILALGFFIGLIDVLDRIARGAFDEFKPALGVGEDEAARLRAQLTSTPDRVGLPATALLMVLISLGYVLDPAGQSGMVGMIAVDMSVMTVLWLPVTALVGLVVVRTIRQLRFVGRLHAMAGRVDLLDPGPVNAFSKLTAATAIGILAAGLLFALPESGQTSLVAIEVVAAVAFTALAIASFVLPLRGMHGRLAAEKARLVTDVNVRLKAVLARLHLAVDQDDLSRADGFQKAQAALFAERDLYLRLSTWPWSQGTFRGFASAVILPVLLGVVLRVLSRFVE